MNVGQGMVGPGTQNQLNGRRTALFNSAVTEQPWSLVTGIVVHIGCVRDGQADGPRGVDAPTSVS